MIHTWIESPLVPAESANDLQPFSSAKLFGKHFCSKNQICFMNYHRKELCCTINWTKGLQLSRNLWLGNRGVSYKGEQLTVPNCMCP